LIPIVKSNGILLIIEGLKGEKRRKKLGIEFAALPSIDGYFHTPKSFARIR
jgi:hypothetical protein